MVAYGISLAPASIQATLERGVMRTVYPGLYYRNMYTDAYESAIKIVGGEQYYATHKNIACLLGGAVL